MPRNRRGFLRSAVATTLGIGIAGCTGTSDESSESASTASTSTTSPSTETAAQEATTTTTTTTVTGPIDHPSAVGIEDEPMLGGKPWETDAALIMFSDPSCPYCGMFERNVFPELKQKLIDPGTVSYVYRTYPSVKPWGERAVQALESVYRRNEGLFWALRDHYYNNPGESVLTERTTRSFLEEHGDVDVDAVITDMKQRAYQGAVDEDMNAAQAADMTTIPSYAIVVDGTVRTTAHGVSSYENIKTMLGV